MPPSQNLFLLVLQRERDVSADGHDGAAGARAQRPPEREHDVLFADRRRRLLLRQHRQDIRRAEQAVRSHDHVSSYTQYGSCWTPSNLLYPPSA